MLRLIDLRRPGHPSKVRRSARCGAWGITGWVPHVEARLGSARSTYHDVGLRVVLRRKDAST